MDYLYLANLLTGLTLIFSSIGPLAFGYSAKLPRIRNLSYLLSAFLIIHGSHHLSWALGDVWLSHEILEPASVLAVIAFGLYLYKTTIPSSTTQNKMSASVPLAGAAGVGAFVIPTNTGPDITTIALFISFAIFIMMVVKNPSIRSLHFQFAIFLSMWSASEVILSLQQLGVNFDIDPNTGLWLHFASMAALGIFVNYRFFGIWRSVKKVGKEVIIQ